MSMRKKHAAASRGVKVWWYVLQAVVFFVLVAGYVGYQYPSQDSCRAMTKLHNDLPLTGDHKTPSLTLTYYQFRLHPCYREIRAKLDAAQMSQREDVRRHEAEKAETARRKAILENPQTVYSSPAAFAAAEAEREKELTRWQQMEPCKSTLNAEAQGRANFSNMNVQEQRSLSELIIENAKNCR
jgi:hypothetical protein